MSEWWTYTLSDFLLFSPRTYYRLFEIYNAAIWPAQIVAVGLGVAIVALVRRAAMDARRERVIAAILAACWLWVAVAFHALRYATINWAAVYFAWAFGLEAALLIWMGIVRGRLRFERPADPAGRAGLGIFLFALVVEPLVGLLLGRGWKGVEVFGVAPDPTAVATLGILLLARIRRRWMLMVIPAIWCAITGATLLAMKAPDAWIPPLAAVLAVAFTRSGSADAPARGSADRPRPRA
ncbi:MAG TPA: DUF6064 family protein [Thermoanaerobaculia bacterium]